MQLIIKSVAVLCSVIFVFWACYAQGNDRTKEIDLAYSKIVSALPNEGQLLLAPYVSRYGFYPETASVKMIDQSRVIGGEAMQIRVKNPGVNPWDIGVFSVIGGEIKQGDTLYMMFWARASELPEGKDTTVLKGVGIQQGSAPYQSLMAKDFTLTSSWKTLALATQANQGFTSNQAQVVYQLAADKHTIEIGPVFVINLGQGVSPASLPYLTK